MSALEHEAGAPRSPDEKLDQLAEQLDRIEADVRAIREVAETLNSVGEQLGPMLTGGGSPMAMLGALMRPAGQ